MKNLILFEEYTYQNHKAVKLHHKMRSSKTLKKIMKTLSLIDDLVHFDFKNIKNTLKNKIGFGKASEMISELSMLVSIMKNENDFNELDLFYDIRRYGFDVDMILNYLDDEDVKKYIDSDKRFKKVLDGKYFESIEFLRKYKKWNDKNKKIF
jgi:hypothetical protein